MSQWKYAASGCRSYGLRTEGIGRLALPRGDSALPQAPANAVAVATTAPIVIITSAMAPSKMRSNAENLACDMTSYLFWVEPAIDAGLSDLDSA